MMAHRQTPILQPERQMLRTTDETEITGDPRLTPGGCIFPLRDFIGATTID